MNVDFSFDAPATKVTDSTVNQIPVPSQTADGESYICGNSGAEHSYANAGRDQDRSRQDERIQAQGSARYVS